MQRSASTGGVSKGVALHLLAHPCTCNAIAMPPHTSSNLLFANTGHSLLVPHVQVGPLRPPGHAGPHAARHAARREAAAHGHPG